MSLSIVSKFCADQDGPDGPCQFCRDRSSCLNSPYYGEEEGA